MFKKFLSLTLALVMALGLVAGAVDYKDASNISDYAEEAVDFAYDLNLMQGNDKGEFRPKDLVTREQMFRIIYALDKAGSTNVSNAYLSFLSTDAVKDVADITAWAKAFAGFAVATELFKGDGTGNLLPKGNITYEQAVVVLLRMLGYSTEYIQSRDPSLNWNANAIRLALTEGLLEGLPASTKYGTAATRQDIAVLLYNALQAKTVVYSKDLGYTKGDNLLKAKFGAVDTIEGIVMAFLTEDTDDFFALGKGEDEELIFIEAGKYGTYVLFTEDGPFYYDLAKSEAYNADMIGRAAKFSFRKDKDDNVTRINNLAAISNSKEFANVRADKVSAKLVDENTKVEFNIDGEKFKVDEKKVALYAAGNGIPAINVHDEATWSALAESKAIDVVVNKIDDITFVGAIGLYDSNLFNVPTFGTGIISDLKDGYVIIEVKSHIGADKKLVFVADDLNGAVKGDVVVFETDFTDFFAGKNTSDAITKAVKDLGSKEYSGNADMKLLANVSIVDVLEPIAVKNGKIVKTVKGTSVSYTMDGKEIDVSAFAEKGLDLNKYAAASKDSSDAVYMLDKYVYHGTKAAPVTTKVTYSYGIFVDQYYNNDGAFVKLLMGDGNTVELAVNQVNGKDAKQTNLPIKYVGGFVFGIANLYNEDQDGLMDGLDKNTVISFVANGDKYDIFTSIKENQKNGENDADFSKVTPSGEFDITVSTLASGRKINGVYYTNSTVIFVTYNVYDDEDVLVGPKTVALNVANLKSNNAQDGMKGTYITQKVGGTNVVIYAFLDLTKTTEEITLVTPAVDASNTIVLTEAPSVVVYPDKAVVTLTGIVGGKMVSYVYNADKDISLASALTGVKYPERFALTIEDGKLKSISAASSALSFKKVAIFNADLGIVGLEGESALDFASDYNVFYFKDNKLADKYDVKLDDANHRAAYVLKDGKVAELYIIDKAK